MALSSRPAPVTGEGSRQVRSSAKPGTAARGLSKGASLGAYLPQQVAARPGSTSPLLPAQRSAARHLGARPQHSAARSDSPVLGGRLSPLADQAEHSAGGGGGAGHGGIAGGEELAVGSHSGEGDGEGSRAAAAAAAAAGDRAAGGFAAAQWTPGRGLAQLRGRKAAAAAPPHATVEPPSSEQKVS